MRLKLHWQILITLILAISLAIFIRLWNLEESSFTTCIITCCEIVGKLFMNALKMVVVPLIVSSIICGIMGFGSKQDFGRIGLKTFLFYAVTGIIAVLIGLFLVNVIQPGIVSEEVARKILGKGDVSVAFVNKLTHSDVKSFQTIFMNLIPSNIIAAASDNGKMLGLIMFSLLFGFFIGKLPERLRASQEDLWEGIQKVMMGITHVIIQLAPIGVFGLIMPVVLRAGTDLIGPIMVFSLTVIAGLMIHFFVALWLMLRFFGRIKPWEHYKAMAPVLLMAFSTASTASTLPFMMERVGSVSGVSQKTVNFTLPLGASVNMNGTALYECVVVLFIAQLYGVVHGISFGLGDQLTVVLLALLTSVGIGGIPASGLVAITIILGAVGLPLESVGVIWVVERILDMCRTTVNVFSDTCAAVIIARTEGEKTHYTNV